MKLRRLIISVVFLLGFCLTGLQAQQAITSAGVNGSGIGGSVSYTVGQVVYQTHTGTNGSVAEGMQQPYKISEITAIEEAKDINLSVLAYPNPVTNHLVLTIESIELSSLNFQLFDMQGKLLQSEKITGNQTSIFMGILVPSVYFLKVKQNNKELKTFRIIKTE